MKITCFCSVLEQNLMKRKVPGANCKKYCPSSSLGTAMVEAMEAAQTRRDVDHPSLHWLHKDPWNPSSLPMPQFLSLSHG